MSEYCINHWCQPRQCNFRSIGCTWGWEGNYTIRFVNWNLNSARTMVGHAKILNRTIVATTTNDDDAANNNNDKSLKSKEYSSRRKRPTRLHDNPPPTPLPPRAKRNRRRSPLRRPSKQHAATAASRTRWAPRMTSALRGAARRNGMLRSDTILRLWGGVNLNKLWLV